jgi:hypothetical protein
MLHSLAGCPLEQRRKTKAERSVAIASSSLFFVGLTETEAVARLGKSTRYQRQPHPIFDTLDYWRLALW